MKEAYSFTLKRNVKVDEVTNTSENFGCLNRDCDALYRIRAINSSITKHFSRLPSTKHIQDCVYDFRVDNFLENSRMIKYDVNAILNGSKSNGKKTFDSPSKNTLSPAPQYIRTPKQLLNYCLANSLETEYIAPLTVGDIILDNRNLLSNENFKGIEGTRLLLGHTQSYDKNGNSLTLEIKGKATGSKSSSLYAEVVLSEDQLDEIKKYIFGLGQRFKGHYIAVLGIWEKTEMNNVKTKISNPRNVIYKFTS